MQFSLQLVISEQAWSRAEPDLRGKSSITLIMVRGPGQTLSLLAYHGQMFFELSDKAKGIRIIHLEGETLPEDFVSSS